MRREYCCLYDTEIITQAINSSGTQLEYRQLSDEVVGHFNSQNQNIFLYVKFDIILSACVIHIAKSQDQTMATRTTRFLKQMV